jgi:hypothetical protein
MYKKKIAAAMAAVTAFIKTGEEAAAYQNAAPAQIPGEQVPPAMPAVQMNLWGVSGRQALMQANTMMQLRMFK